MGKIITKLYKYDSSQENNNYRGQDFSQYILLANSDIDNLDDTLDTVELTLVGLPFREEFAPSSKFIFEKWEKQIDSDGNPIETMWKDWHLCVSTDTVEQPILSDENYFNHNITFYEASVEAQKRLVDNISITYRLQDVTIDSVPTYDTNSLAIVKRTNVDTTPPEKFGETYGFIWDKWNTGHNFFWVMPNWYEVTINGETKTPSWDDWYNLKLNEEIPSGQNSKTIEIPTPMLQCWCGASNSTGYILNGYCSIDVIVQRTQIGGDNPETIQQIRVNPAADTPTESRWVSDDVVADTSQATGFGQIWSRITATGVLNVTQGHWSQVARLSPTKTNRVISITIESGYKYNVIVKRAVFDTMDGNMANTSPSQIDKYPAFYSQGLFVQRIFSTDVSNTAVYVDDNYPLTTLSFNGVLQGTDFSIYIKSAPVETALKLYTRAVLASQNFYRQDNISADNTIVPFYLEDQDKQELNNTQVVENFYNQKNLWEIQMDIGKYIHARPLIRFGSNNRFVTTWKRYGLTTQYNNLATPISIYNSRFIEDYISSCSSYVTNMVQLGGIITETVAPKSSSEDYLVYNNVAEIVVEKPIIEIVDVDIIRKSDGEIRNLTGHGTHGESSSGYIFEESVYNILSINANDSVNKGLALYYQLGTNKIVGLQYQLPTINTGDADSEYAIKRIIGTVFLLPKQDGITGGWKAIKVNDYLFRIKYRTKDTLRADQTRPDLRKYLLSTPYDRVPQHNQFNNQQDVVVDSVKFGNNLYGKLIRTGNTIYTKLEWVNSLFELKQSGELYTIDGNLYYVSKVKNTYYEDHIESEVEFSKDFNRLSQIIGIPSEPRFYEIAERNIIDREISFDDYIVLGTSNELNARNDNFISNNYGLTWVKNALFGEHTVYPKYAITVFKNDKEKETAFGNETFYVETCSPACSYSIENTLSIEWDMKDNFSAGDQVGETSLSIEPSSAEDTAYNTLKPYRYVDVYGRCDLVDFAIVDDINLLDPTSPNFSKQDVLDLPENPIDLTTAQNIVFTSAKNVNDYANHEKGLIVLKDARETLKFNYNLQMITDSDRFVLSAYMWQQDKSNLKIGLLSEEINKLSNATITNRDFAIENIPFVTSIETDNIDITKQGIKISIYDALSTYATNHNTTLTELLDGIKAIVIYSTNEINDYVNSGAKYFVCGRNIGGLSVENASQDWYINYRNNNMFPQQ